VQYLYKICTRKGESNSEDFDQLVDALSYLSYLTMSTTTVSTVADNACFNAEAVKWDSNAAQVRCCEMALESVLHHVPAFANSQAKSRIVQIRSKL
jgi:hypothetical protein